MAGGNFVHRVMSYVINELVVDRLANSPAFQRFAVRTSKKIEDISSMAAQKRQELTEQMKELSKNMEVQCIEMEIEDDNFKGVPFVLLSGGKWIKNNDSDFYVEFNQKFKQVQKDAGDGKGTSKALLDRITEMESEA